MLKRSNNCDKFLKQVLENSSTDFGADHLQLCPPTRDRLRGYFSSSAIVTVGKTQTYKKEIDCAVENPFAVARIVNGMALGLIFAVRVGSSFEKRASVPVIKSSCEEESGVNPDPKNGRLRGGGCNLCVIRLNLIAQPAASFVASQIAESLEVRGCPSSVKRGSEVC